MIALFSVVFALSYLLPVLVSFALWTQAYRFGGPNGFQNYLLTHVVMNVAAVLVHIFVAISFLDPRLISGSGWVGIIFGWIVFAIITIWAGLSIPEMEHNVHASRVNHSRVTPIRRAS